MSIQARLDRIERELDAQGNRVAVLEDAAAIRERQAAIKEARRILHEDPGYIDELRAAAVRETLSAHCPAALAFRRAGENEGEP
jgi:hypothetical protein